MDVLDGGMLVGEKILLTSNSSKNVRAKNGSAENRKSSRGRASSRKHRARANLKQLRGSEKEEDFETISSSISSDTDSEEPGTNAIKPFCPN